MTLITVVMAPVAAAFIYLRKKLLASRSVRRGKQSFVHRYKQH